MDKEYTDRLSFRVSPEMKAACRDLGLIPTGRSPDGALTVSNICRAAISYVLYKEMKYPVDDELALQLSNLGKSYLENVTLQNDAERRRRDLRYRVQKFLLNTNFKAVASQASSFSFIDDFSEMVEYEILVNQDFPVTKLEIRNAIKDIYSEMYQVGDLGETYQELVKKREGLYADQI